MRYARGKQLAQYVCKGINKDYRRFKEMRGAIGNLKIEENVTLPPYCNELDPTFKWQRDLKTVQFDAMCTFLDLSIETMATKVICLKYPNGVPRFVSIYPHQLDC
ncbi:hypothetical protein Q0N88_24300 [Bacillus thuringiensis]|uniref:hypothetical protein n=1 Tax=Bacillus thuringiensis TaxID=1428 RepID=UPI003458787A